MSGEILTIQEMATADAFASAHGTPTLELMENAGAAVAREITTRWSQRSVAVLCGPGNNGGDGFAAARHLKERGWSVAVAKLGEKWTGDAGAMEKRWEGESVKLSPEALAGAGLIVDGLFGAGLSRPLEGAARATVTALTQSDLPVIAIDVPSGLSGDRAAPLGDACVRADLTVTFFRKKAAHVLMPGRLLCGTIVVADIGIPAAALRIPMLFENAPDFWGAAYPWPQPLAHKYARGHCVVVSGPAHATGAARLGARAALRVGAGLVSVASPPDAISVNAGALTAIMVKPFSGPKDLSRLLADKRFNAVVIGPGCGVGEATRDLVAAVLGSGAAAVLDADALTSFHDDPAMLFDLLRGYGAGVLTPHEGEFERIFPGLLAGSVNKIEAARAAAARGHATVLLKGPDTAIAAPDGRALVNTNALPELATAGAGDVLAGLIGGLLAQGMEPLSAAGAAAWLHGAAASLFGPGLIAEDLPEMLPKALGALRYGFSSSHPLKPLL